MGLFGKLKKKGAPEDAFDGEQAAPAAEGGAADADSEGNKGGKKKKLKKKRKKDAFMNLFQESVFSAVKELLDMNQPFLCRDGYIVFAVTEDLLDKVDGEDKGTFVAYVRNGNIQAYMSEESLSDGYITTVPDQDTLNCMDEFDFLSDAMLEAVLVRKDGSMQPLGVGAGLKDLLNYYAREHGYNTLTFGDYLLSFDGSGGEAPSDGGGQLNQYAPYDDGSDADSDPVLDGPSVHGYGGGGPDGPAGPSYRADFTVDGPGPDAGRYQPPQHEEPVLPGDSGWGGFPDVPDAGGDVPEPFGYGGMDEGHPDPTGGDVPEFGDSAGGFMPDAYADEGGASGAGDFVPEEQGAGHRDSPQEPEAPDAVEQVTTEADVYRAVKRLYFREDLDLEVTTEPFDSQFLSMEHFAKFDSERPEGFLNDYLNNMARDANADMESRYLNDMQALKEEYLSTLSGVCDYISKSLSIDNPTAKYGVLRLDLVNKRKKEEEQVEALVIKKRAELEDSWKADIQRASDAAAQRAAQDHINRFGRMHKTEMAEVEDRIRDDITLRFEKSMGDMDRSRHVEANRMLELGINNTLLYLSSKYREMVEREMDAYNAHAKRMRDFADSNMKQEIEYIEVMREQQRQQQLADSVRKELMGQIEDNEARYKRQISDLEQQLSDTNRNVEERIRQRDEYYEGKMKQSMQVEKDLRETIAHNHEQLVQMDARKSEEYTHQLRVKDDIIAAQSQTFNEQMREMEARTKNTSRLSVALIVGAGTIGLFVGILFGVFMALNRPSASVSVNTSGAGSGYNVRYEEQAPAQQDVPGLP